MLADMEKEHEEQYQARKAERELNQQLSDEAYQRGLEEVHRQANKWRRENGLPEQPIELAQKGYYGISRSQILAERKKAVRAAWDFAAE